VTVLRNLKENAVVFARTTGSYSYPKHKTPYLSVTNHLSTGNYQLNGQNIKINDKFFYFLNANDDLEISFSGKYPLETLFILFDLCGIAGSVTMEVVEL